MAQILRLGIFLVSLALAGVAFFNLATPWAWLVPLALAGIGALISERVFKTMATPEEKQRDLEDRTRNPPS